MELSRTFRNADGEPYCTVVYDEKNKWVFDSWSGIFGAQESFRKAVLHWKDLVVAYKTSRGLTDVSRMIGSFDGSKEWMQKIVMPQVVSAGLRHHAMVIPKNIFAKLSAKDYVMIMKDYEVQMFDDIDKAKKWLLSK